MEAYSLEHQRFLQGLKTDTRLRNFSVFVCVCVCKGRCKLLGSLIHCFHMHLSYPGKEGCKLGLLIVYVLNSVSTIRGGRWGGWAVSALSSPASAITMAGWQRLLIAGIVFPLGRLHITQWGWGNQDSFINFLLTNMAGDISYHSIQSNKFNLKVLSLSDLDWVLYF